MPGIFKLYAVLLLVLIGAQMVLAGEKMVDFQRALKEYEKEREPNQEPFKKSKSSFKNPPIEISLQKESKKRDEKERKNKNRRDASVE